MSLPPASRTISSHQAIALQDGWQLVGTAPGSVDFEQLETADLYWQAAIVPGTVALSLHDDINAPGAYDQRDWWYRLRFAAPAPVADPSIRYRLRCDGLATLADVWLNGTLMLSSSNMFCSEQADITALLQNDNTLVIRFRSLTAALEQKRPRPRWKTALVQDQNLRWFRTALLGRIPAWSPPIEPVGPWRPIWLETLVDVDVTSLQVQSRLHAGIGSVHLHMHLHELGSKLQQAELVVGEHRQRLEVVKAADATVEIHGVCTIASAPVWWPHTHGEQPLLPCRVELQTDDRKIIVNCGNVGFKQIEVKRDDGALTFVVNGVPVFCRGACWTTSDILSLAGNPQSLRAALQLARDANLNMLRIGGTMTYEQDTFFQLCDELGILVWQDFMFANMDYPVGDHEFLANIRREVEQQLTQLSAHVSVAAYCAGSEIEQQAAMMGLPASEWSNPFFSEQLPALCAQHHSGIPYFRGSPSEGSLPFHPSTGPAHYYGVGAYRRPLSDARHAGVKFASECLGISNVPGAETMGLLLEGKIPVPHHPRWKARVPRDNGSGYDFEDIRDFYLKELYQLDPVQLRSENTERYYALSRTVSGEVMLRTFAEWRRNGNPCSGGLIWFYQDLWPGAGWGIVDSESRPKATWHYLQRAWAPRAVLLTDAGLDGLQLTAYNDYPTELPAEIEIGLLQHGKVKTLDRRFACTLAPHGQQSWSVDAIIGHFTDCNYAYRFGPPGHDTAYCRLLDSTGNLLGEDVFFLLRQPAQMQDLAHIQTEVSRLPDGNIALTLSTGALLQDVCFTSTDHVPDRNHFHLIPGHTYSIHFRSLRAGKKFKAHLNALNLWESITVRER